MLTRFLSGQGGGQRSLPGSQLSDTWAVFVCPQTCTDPGNSTDEGMRHGWGKIDDAVTNMRGKK